MDQALGRSSPCKCEVCIARRKNALVLYPAGSTRSGRTRGVNKYGEGRKLGEDENKDDDEDMDEGEDEDCF